MTGNDYPSRAELYGLETAEVPSPASLSSMLGCAAAVAEVPAGVGHFLDEYAAARSRVTLLDTEPRMLAVASERMVQRSIEGSTALLELGVDTPVDTFDLVVCPNAAFNYLVALLGLAETATSLVALVRPGGALLLQVLAVHADGRVDRCGCYDPNAVHETWFTEWTRTDHKGRSLTRRRWQRRTGDVVEVRMERFSGSRSLGTSSIALRLLGIDTTSAAFVAAGLRLERTAHGHHRLSELVFRHNDSRRGQ